MWVTDPKTDPSDGFTKLNFNWSPTSARIYAEIFHTCELVTLMPVQFEVVDKWTLLRLFAGTTTFKDPKSWKGLVVSIEKVPVLLLVQ